MSTSKTQLSALTGMRFLLALWVVVFHQRFVENYVFKDHLPGPIASLLDTGYLAVGIFFLLSGFVLSYNYPLDKKWSAGEIKKFGLARFARIYPAYALALLLSIPGVIAALAQAQERINIHRETIKVAMVWTLTQAWRPATAAAWNKPAWSLSNEAFFYLLFPFVGVLLWKARTVRSVLAAALFIWLASLIGPAVAVTIPLRDSVGTPASMWNGDSYGNWVTFLKFWPIFHVPEFCFGILTGRLYRILSDKHGWAIGKGYWLYLPGLALEVAAIAKWGPTLFPFLHDGLMIPVHALVILGFAFDGGWLAKALATRPLVLLGNASYSVYIFQSPIGGWMSMIAKRVFAIKLSGWGAATLHMVVLTAFSVTVFILVEEPANRFLKTKLAALLGITSRGSAGRPRISVAELPLVSPVDAATRPLAMVMPRFERNNGSPE